MGPAQGVAVGLGTGRIPLFKAHSHHRGTVIDAGGVGTAANGPLESSISVIDRILHLGLLGKFGLNCRSDATCLRGVDPFFLKSNKISMSFRLNESNIRRFLFCHSNIVRLARQSVCLQIVAQPSFFFADFASNTLACWKDRELSSL